MSRWSARAVLFDLDGTLLDTAPDMAGALQALLGEHGREPLALETVRPHVSHGGRAVVRHGFPDHTEDDALLLLQRFLQLYHGRIALETRLFPGMDELLESLERTGIPWGVVTNKPGWLTEPLLAALGLDTRAGVIVSGDTLDVKKPHPGPLLHAAERIGVAPQACLYIGDAERDVIAARAAGMRALVARFGYIGPTDKVEDWPAHGWIDTPLEIRAWL